MRIFQWLGQLITEEGEMMQKWHFFIIVFDPSKSYCFLWACKSSAEWQSLSLLPPSAFHVPASTFHCNSSLARTDRGQRQTEPFCQSHQGSIMTDHNSPRRVIKAGSHAGKGIAVFTSGGDSQGETKVTGCQRFWSFYHFFLSHQEWTLLWEQLYDSAST